VIGGAGADVLNGGSQVDTADYSGSLGFVHVSLATGMGFGNDAQGDTLVDIEDVVGSDFADVLIGSDTEVSGLYGGEGNDSLFGGTNDDFIQGDAGADYAQGGTADDTIYGGPATIICTVAPARISWMAARMWIFWMAVTTLTFCAAGRAPMS
jgi:Ca2+-binding RTX toxin-like protein